VTAPLQRRAGGFAVGDGDAVALQSARAISAPTIDDEIVLASMSELGLIRGKLLHLEIGDEIGDQIHRLSAISLAEDSFDQLPCSIVRTPECAAG